MKKVILFLIVLFLFSSGKLFSQTFRGNISGTFGILNTKVRVQYERPLSTRGSYGINVNYYFLNWTGPVFEPFIRIYGKKGINDEGFFGQFKLMYGNLSVVDYDFYQSIISNRRWSTFGAGIACGYKFLLGKHFTMEPLGGIRFLSPPMYRFNTGYDYDDYAGFGESIGWYLTTGFPIDFQLKFGYQF